MEVAREGHGPAFTPLPFADALGAALGEARLALGLTRGDKGFGWLP
jgi:hypothetical protein